MALDFTGEFSKLRVPQPLTPPRARTARADECSHAVSKKPAAGPASTPGDGEGRMWSLFPQTSSSNLNNNLYLHPRPRPPPGLGGTHAPASVRGAPDPGRRRGPPRVPALPQLPEARRGSAGGERARGRGMGAGSAPRRPRGSRACPPRSRASPAAAAAASPRYLGSDPAGRSPRRCHSALCETDTHNPS